MVIKTTYLRYAKPGSWRASHEAELQKMRRVIFSRQFSVGGGKCRQIAKYCCIHVSVTPLVGKSFIFRTLTFLEAGQGSARTLPE